MSGPVRQRVVILLGGALHAAILLPPVLWRGRLADPAVWLFLLLATAFYFGDALGSGQSVSTPQTLATGSRTAGALALASGLTLLAVFWIGLASRGQSGSVTIGLMQLVGGAAMLAGAALRRAATCRLGPFFVSEPRVVLGQPLVTTGIYRLLRHPSETGLLTAGLGACLFCGSPLAIAVWAAVLIPLVVIRLRIEERVLRAGFGEPYRQYARRTGALLPLPGRWPWAGQS